MRTKERLYFFGIDYPPARGGISTYVFNWVARTSEYFSGTIEALFFGNSDPRTEQNGDALFIHTIRGRGILTIFVRVGFSMFLRPAIAYHALNLFPVGFIVVVWGVLFRKKTIVTLYGTESTSKKSSAIARYLKVWTIQHATHVIAISDFTKSEVERRLRIYREIIRIYPTLPIKKIDDSIPPLNDSRILESDFMILSIGRLVRRKGVDDLIHAVADLPDRQWKVIIIGSGPEKNALQKQVQDRGIQSNVLFLGDVSDLCPYYRRANLCVLLSSYIQDDGDFEGLGLVLLEAQQYGIPVIGTKSGGIPEAILSGQTGLLVSEHDSNAIRDAIEEIRHSAGRHSMNSKRKEEFLESRFGDTATVGFYLDIISH